MNKLCHRIIFASTVVSFLFKSGGHGLILDDCRIFMLKLKNHGTV
jgi:hypothetical protein